MAHSVVLVGLGKMGSEYARTIAAHPDLEVVGAVSPSSARTREFSSRFGILGAYTSVGEAYRSTKAQAAIISVPPRVVSEVLVEAWAYPWKCLTEKPAGSSLAESSNLLAEQHKAHQPPSVALNRRFYSQVQEIRSQLDALPGSKFIVSRDQYFVGKSPASRGAQLYEKAIHMVDLFSFLLSDVHVGASSGFERVGKDGMLASSRIEFSQGSHVHYSTALNIPGRWSISVFSESRNWVLEPLEDGWVNDLQCREPRKMAKSEKDILFKPGLSAMLDELVLELNGAESRLPSLEDSHTSMRLLSEAFSSLGLPK